MGDHMVIAYSSMGRVLVLYVLKSFFFVFSLVYCSECFRIFNVLLAL